MFGQFSSEPFDNNEALNAARFELGLERDRKEDINEFFDGYTQGVKILTGKEYLSLFEIGMNAGFTDKEFKTYLEEHGISVKSALPPTEDSSAVSFDTPDNGKY
jgi:hypothetical protein